jgi:hypothetical protein
MTTRKALLISATGLYTHESDIVNKDLEAARNFLLSPRGGAWNLTEIQILQEPDLKTMLKAVKEMHADYTITVFSGKGFPDKSGNHFLMLGDGDFFQDTELLNGSEKQLVLVDACPESFSDKTILFDGHPSEYDTARKMYDRWIENCEPGQLIMHSTEANTFTSQKNHGGLFTRKLLLVASNVPSVKDRFNLKSILAAGHETPDLLLEEGFEEGPAITYSNGNIKLPFAMAMPAPQSLLPKISDGGYSQGFTLGIFLIGLLLSLD